MHGEKIIFYNGALQKARVIDSHIDAVLKQTLQPTESHQTLRSTIKHLYESYPHPLVFVLPSSQPSPQSSPHSTTQGAIYSVQ